MVVEFTAHNIRLDNGNQTKPEIGYLIESHPWCISAKRVLETVFPGDKRHLRIVDLGCLEGGYAVEFARMGFQSLGIDVRESNIEACRYVQAHTNLPNLDFVQDDAWNIEQHGVFDAVFCCGIFYHFDRPKQYLELLSKVTKKLLILQTHFATDQPNPKYGLSDISENEGIQGRWYPEFSSEDDFKEREKHRWSSWDNRNSFWPKREYLLQLMQNAGFDLVMEQYDSLGADIVGSMTQGYYKTDERGTFIGIKTRA